ncbi:homeodomain-interacting protein kinase 2-like [Rhinolophus ferrumequinum]|uniref:homeodomain-interacting protein kinase 2-like n=1 Tax=Rhinolophus ferrumequinum TaxID=59479 RepID=UPI00140FE84F|nr:homeodomain-interacting protein kinase 2-like [Rhinolophus ferrumequinum]
MAGTQQLADWRNTHAHGSHYNPIMQQPALLTGHVTLPAAQPLNVGVAHVMRQQPTSTTSSRKSKQHQSSARVSVTMPGTEWVVNKYLDMCLAHFHRPNNPPYHSPNSVSPRIQKCTAGDHNL